MAAIATELATLRALTFRISSTNTAQLPQHVPAIASSLANCKTLLSSSQGSGSKAASNSEASVVVHKFRTLLSTLLQDRTIQGRWAAIILIKASIEVGGWETLQKCLPWVRGLLGILTKPDPHSSKKLCIITLTRIFMLTREFPTLVREITTPSLPTFVQNCLQIANAKAPAGLLQIILESFGELLPRHPTIFRSYLKQLHPLLARLIAPTPSSKLAPEPAPGAKLEATSSVISAAQRLYAQLPCCAPKGASSEEWQKSLKNTISAVHGVADKVFRAVHEEWQLSTRTSASVTGQTLDDEVQDLEAPDLALPPWSGFFAGNERLIHLLRLIQQFLDSPTANAVNLNVAALIDLTSRLLSLTVPSAGSKSFQTSIRFNNQVSKDERENLFSILPGIHVCTIDLLLSLANRTQASTLSLDSILLDQLSWVFGAESNLVQVRTGCYAALTAILQRSGAALTKSSVDTLAPLLRSCCNDLLPAENMISGSKDTAPAKTNGAAKPQVTANADAFLSTSKAFADPTSGLLGLKDAAYNLLPVLLANLKAQYLSDSLRARLDRTAILIQHKDAMVNSVLNPPPSKKFGKPAASILPLLARSFPAERDAEGMLRPRMPVIRTNADNAGSEDVEGDGEENEDDDAPEEEMGEGAIQQELEQAASPEKPEEESTMFAGHELDSILEAAGRATASGADTSMPDATPAETKPSITAPALDVSRYEPVASKDKPKRPPPTDAPLSPSKRMKGGEDTEKKTIPPSMPMPTRSTRSSARMSDVPATSDCTVTTTASAIPELPTPGDGAVGEDSDDDEDDVIPLVLGQDTDDEDDD